MAVRPHTNTGLAPFIITVGWTEPDIEVDERVDLVGMLWWRVRDYLAPEGDHHSRLFAGIGPRAVRATSLLRLFFRWLTYAEFGTRYRLLLDSGYEVVDVISQEDVVL